MTEDLNAIHQWTQEYGLAINPSKTQVMIVGSNYFISRLNVKSLTPVKYNNFPLQYCSEVKNLGLYITSNLSWDAQVAHVSKRMYGSMHSLKLMKNFLPQSTRMTLVNALLFPILDYADVCYPDATEEQLNKLERLQNLCIRFVFGLRKYDHVSVFRTQLKWLKIRKRRDLHTLCLLYKTLGNPLSPKYLSESFSPLYGPERNARHSKRLQLAAPDSCTVGYHRTFAVKATRLWNSLPLEYREATSINVFKSRVYNHFLSQE